MYVVLHLNLNLFEPWDSCGVEKIRAQRCVALSYPKTTQRYQILGAVPPIVDCQWPTKGNYDEDLPTFKM